MLLRDPYALNAICKSILHCLLHLYEQSKLPRVSVCSRSVWWCSAPLVGYHLVLVDQDSSELECLLRLLQLGLKSHSIIESKEYREDQLVMSSCVAAWQVVLISDALHPHCL